MTAAFAGTLGFALLEDERALGIPRAAAAALPALFTLGSLIFVGWAWSRHWPRGIARLADLEKVPPR